MKDQYEIRKEHGKCEENIEYRNEAEQGKNERDRKTK